MLFKLSYNLKRYPYGVYRLSYVLQTRYSVYFSTTQTSQDKDLEEIKRLLSRTSREIPPVEYYGKEVIETLLVDSTRYTPTPIEGRPDFWTNLQKEEEDFDYLRAVFICKAYPEVLDSMFENDLTWSEIYKYVTQSSLYQLGVSKITLDAAQFVSFPHWVQENLTSSELKNLRDDLSTISKVRFAYSESETRYIKAVKKLLYQEFGDGLKTTYSFEDNPVLFIMSLTIFDFELKDFIRIEKEKREEAIKRFKELRPMENWEDQPSKEKMKIHRQISKALVSKHRGYIYKMFKNKDEDTIKRLKTICEGRKGKLEGGN